MSEEVRSAAAAGVLAADELHGSLVQSIRLYKYSISYLTLLFAAVALDALVVVHL